MEFRSIMGIFILWRCTCTASVPANEREYCSYEYFNASCPSGHAVVMQTARYGQMRTGRCMPTDYGGQGCSEDVLRYMDAECSGRQHCSMEVPGVLKRSQPCPSGLLPFLLASYKCVEVTETSRRPCFPPENTVIPVKGEGYLTPSVNKRGSMATGKCTLVLQASPRQRIELTLFDFSGPFASLTADGRRSENEVVKVEPNGSCVRYAVVRSEGVAHPKVVCQSANRRTDLLSSLTNTVEVTFAKTTEKDAHFLLQYKVTGCPQLKPPTYGWLEESEDGVRVGCNHTAERWHIACDGNKWIGSFSNCSASKIDGIDNSVSLWFTMDESHWTTPVGILIVTALGIALGLLLGVLLLAIAVFFIKRRHSRCFYGNHSYEEAKLTHCDAHGVYYGQKPPSENTPTHRMEHIELNPHHPIDGNMTFQPQQYGTMAVLKYKPPSYTSQTTTSGQNSPAQGSVRSVRRVERLDRRAQDCGIMGSNGDLFDDAHS